MSDLNEIWAAILEMDGHYGDDYHEVTSEKLTERITVDKVVLLDILMQQVKETVSYNDGPIEVSSENAEVRVLIKYGLVTHVPYKIPILRIEGDKRYGYYLNWQALQALKNEP